MKVTKRKAKGVLADMIANIDEDSLAKTREEMMRITEDYCSYEIAKLLKEKRFPMGEHLFMHVNKDNVFMTDDYACLKLPWEEYKNFDEVYIPTITHQMAMKWLREMHNVHIVIEYYEVDGEGFYGWIVKTGGERYHCHQAFSKDYKEAVEAALKYSLENLI